MPSRRRTRRGTRGLVARLVSLAVIAVLGYAGIRGVGVTSGPASPARSVAPADLLIRASAVTGALAQAPSTATVTGRTSGVRLLSYGYVTGYQAAPGTGSPDLSAPAGQRLVAFKAQPGSGEEGPAARTSPQLSVRIDGVERGPLVVTSDYVVAAVPATAATIDLVLTDSGVKQGLSLITGRPDQANPVVCGRTHRLVRIAATRAVSVRVSTKSGAGMTSGTLTVSSVALSYWGQDGSVPTSTSQAFLHIAAGVRLAGDRTGYGAEAGLLTVSVAGGAPLHARNVAENASADVDDVVEVPANVTSGVITYSGTVTTKQGTLTVTTPVSVPFTSPAG